MLESVSFDGAELRNVSFEEADFTGGGVTFDGARLSNVDFTGASGLQYIDWSRVTIDGPVYGLASVAHLIDIAEHPEYLRSFTVDAERPGIDADTGYDISPAHDFLIDPATGVRLERAENGALRPVDDSGQELTSPEGNPLEYARGQLYDPMTNFEYRVDYETGRLDARVR